MSDDFNEDGDVLLNPEDIVSVLELDEEGNLRDQDGNLVSGLDGRPIGENGHHSSEEEDGEEGDDNEMDTDEAAGGGAAAPTQDDSLMTFSGHQNDAVICCEIHPTNNEIAATGGQDDRALVWNIKSGDTLFECTGHTDTVLAVGFSADGTLVASGDMKGLVQVWAVPSGAMVWSFEVGDIEWLQWHQVAPVLMAGTKEGEVWMWKVPAGDCKTFPSHGAGAMCGRILPDGKHCCVGYEDGTIKIWDLRGGDAVFTISGHEGHKSSVLCMDVKGNTVVTGSEDGTTKVISLTNGKVTSTLQCGGGAPSGKEAEKETYSVEAIGLSAVNDYVATGTLSGKLEVWDLSSKSVRHRFEHPFGIVKIQWSPSTPMFYTACLDGCVRQFDSLSGQLMKTWQGHTDGILDITLPKDGSFVLSASDDFTAKLFSIASQS